MALPPHSHSTVALVLLLIQLFTVSGTGYAATALADGDVVVVLGESSEPLSLEAILGIALEKDPAVQDARAALMELEGQKIRARSGGLPRLEATLNWNRGRDPSFALDETFGGGGLQENPFTEVLRPLYDQHAGLDMPDLPPVGFVLEPEDIPAQSFWRTSLDARWDFRPTQLGRAVRAARRALSAQELRILGSQHAALARTTELFQDVLLAEAERRAVSVEIEAREAFLASTRQRLDLGMVTPLDTLRAAVRVANLQPQLRRAELAFEEAGRNLNLSLGRVPQAELALVASFPIDENELADADFYLMQSASRPDLLAQERVVELWGLQRGSQKANSHPYFSLEGRYGYVARDFNNLFESGLDFWNVSASVNWAFWDGQTSGGLVRETEGSLRRAELELRRLRHAARDEVLSALGALRAAREELAASELLLVQAEEAADAVVQRYELGKLGQLDVLDSQAERWSARRQLVAARHAVVVAQARLKARSGLSPLHDFPTPGAEPRGGR